MNLRLLAQVAAALATFVVAIIRLLDFLRLQRLL
jgi:hypothetical protein